MLKLFQDFFSNDALSELKNNLIDKYDAKFQNCWGENQHQISRFYKLQFYTKIIHKDGFKDEKL